MILFDEPSTSTDSAGSTDDELGLLTLLKTTRAGGSAPFRRDCSQGAEQHPTHLDNSGTSAQPTTGDGRSWTSCPLLRIRCSPKQSAYPLRARSAGR